MHLSRDAWSLESGHCKPLSPPVVEVSLTDPPCSPRRPIPWFSSSFLRTILPLLFEKLTLTEKKIGMKACTLDDAIQAVRPLSRHLSITFLLHVDLRGGEAYFEMTCIRVVTYDALSRILPCIQGE